MFIKIFLGFLLLAIMETLNGIFRINILQKRFKKNQAKIFSFLLGSIIIFLLNLILIPWIKPENINEAFLIGITWAILMVCYDIFIGKVIFKLSTKKILDDFNIFKGNLLSFGILLIILLPILLV